MLYQGKFSDKNGKVYDVQIRTGTSTEEVPITFSGSPCIIDATSDNLFTPIKSRSCTLEIVSDTYHMDLYQTESRGASVKIKDETTEENIFWGYLTPNEYSQDYTNLDKIQLNCIDAVSTLKDFRFSTKSTYPQYVTFLELVIGFLQECGYQGNCYITESYDTLNGSSVNDILNHLYVSEANFFDDDEEHSPWTKYEVLEEILRFMNWSLCPFGDDVYIVDYRTINDSSTLNYSVFDLSLGSSTIISGTDYAVVKEAINISKDTNAAPGTPTFSIEDVFNKIEVNDNLYEVDEIAPDIDDNILEDVIIPGGMPIGLDNSRWSQQVVVKKHWLTPDEVETDIVGYEYQTVQLFKPDSGWTHHFYQHDSLQEVDNDGDFSNCYDSTSNSQYTTDRINKYCNTLGCVLQHYAYRENNGPSIIPTSLDWTDYLTFFITDDTTGSFTLTNTDRFELPVLEYEVGEEVMWKPSTGTSWVTLKGDLYYQYNGAKYGEKNKQTLNIINEEKKYYTTAPVDKCISIEEQKYASIYRTYEAYKDIGYGDGFSTWKMKVQIGEKWWNGDEWSNTESTFYIKYNNNPQNREDEYFPAFAWCSPVPNTDYTDKVGENCYAIPIDSTDANAPTFGKLKLTVYAPAIVPVEIRSLFSQLFSDNNLSWTDLANIVYAKGFELNYIYTDTTTWYSQKKDDGKNDVVYTNVINDNYTNEFDDIELRINTQIKDKPISRSYACTSNDYMKSSKHILGDGSKEQEKNIIDAWYAHHSTPKKVYNCNIHGLPFPDDKFTSDNVIGGLFVVDSYLFDVRNDNIQINLIEF